MSVVKIVRIVGNSPKSWARAAAEATREAARTIRNIQGVEATDFTAKVDENGDITEYRCTVNIAFLIGRGGGSEEEERRGGATGRGAGGAGSRTEGGGGSRTQAGGGAAPGRSGGGASSGPRGGASGGRSGTSRGSDRESGGRSAGGRR